MAKTPTSNIEKTISGGGSNQLPLDMKQFIKLADAEKIEFDVMQNLIDTIQEDFENERRPGESLIDWLKSKPTDYFKRIELKDGGPLDDYKHYVLKSELSEKVKELMDNEGYGFSEAVKEAKRQGYKDGGNVIFISDWIKSKEPKIKELDLASMFTPGKTLSSLTEAEREAVNNLLKLTFGKD